MTTREFEIARGDVTIAGWEHGDRRRRTVVLVHGYPDDATLWDDVVPELADELHVVAYDVRGHGRSSEPKDTAGYAFDHLLADLVAVIDHVSSGRPVHLVGHDWGAIQGWEAASRPDVAERLATFTAVCGPSFDLVATSYRERLDQDPLGGAVALLRQAPASFYLAALQVPVLPERVLGTGVLQRLGERIPALDGMAAPSPTATRDAVNGVNLYRANRRHLTHPRSVEVHVPVHVVTGEHDPFVPPRLFNDLGRKVPHATHQVVAGAGHWLPRTQPSVVAAAIRDVVTGDAHP